MSTTVSRLKPLGSGPPSPVLLVFILFSSTSTNEDDCKILVSLSKFPKYFQSFQFFLSNVYFCYKLGPHLPEKVYPLSNLNPIRHMYHQTYMRFLNSYFDLSLVYILMTEPKLSLKIIQFVHIIVHKGIHIRYNLYSLLNCLKSRPEYPYEDSNLFFSLGGVACILLIFKYLNIQIHIW